MNQHNDVWNAVLGELELTMTKANFTTWFKSTCISAIEGEKVVISVPNLFTQTWLEKKYNAAILKTLQHVCKLPVKELVYRVDMRPPMRPITQAQSYQASSNSSVAVAEPMTQVIEETLNTAKSGMANEARLSQKYTFETYVVGKGSELAHAAAIAVAENPGTKYNPLYIYGGVGLGKTHLMHAVGNAVMAKKPDAKVIYVTSEKFMSEFIQAVKSGRGKEFKDTYRTADLLMIDDIQFLSGKTETQEEFFHTFNTLHEGQKQMVIASDRPPKQIPAFEERLISRLDWGMIVDVSSPDLETRIAILETKCKERGYDLDSDTIRHVATVVQSNVRELEGALNKIVAYHQFKNTRPTLESAKTLLSSMSPQQSRKNVTAKHIIATVCGFYDVAIADMSGKCREKRLAFPRQIIMYLMREEMRSSYPSIGHELGGRDHTTAMHAYEKISRELEANPKTRQDLDMIKQRLYNT